MHHSAPLSRLLPILLLLVISIGNAWAEEGDVELTRKRCAEAGALNPEQLTEEDRFAYDQALKKQSQGHIYTIWPVAEQVSKNPNYPDPVKSHLVFQLICLGGFAPAEQISAVEDFYPLWIKKQSQVFDTCSYITSGAGMGFCSHRRALKQEEEQQQSLEALKTRLPAPLQKELSRTWQLANDYFEVKAEEEEMHGGTARTAWILESIQDQRDEFLKRLLATEQGDLPALLPASEKPEQTMQRLYEKALKRLHKPVRDINMEINAAGVQKVQEQWRLFQKQAAKTLAQMNNDRDYEQWLAILAHERAQELARIFEDIQAYEAE